jgi:hypothetical protein
MFNYTVNLLEDEEKSMYYIYEQYAYLAISTLILLLFFIESAGRRILPE